MKADLTSVDGLSGTYALFDGDQCLYVGASQNLASRLKAQFDRILKSAEFPRAKCWRVSVEHLISAEYDLIERLKPTENGASYIPGVGWYGPVMERWFHHPVRERLELLRHRDRIRRAVGFGWPEEMVSKGVVARAIGYGPFKHQQCDVFRSFPAPAGSRPSRARHGRRPPVVVWATEEIVDWVSDTMASFPGLIETSTAAVDASIDAARAATGSPITIEISKQKECV